MRREEEVEEEEEEEARADRGSSAITNDYRLSEEKERAHKAGASHCGECPPRCYHQSRVMPGDGCKPERALASFLSCLSRVDGTKEAPRQTPKRDLGTP